MNPLSNPLLPTKCPICGNLVPSECLSEHLLADACMLRIIKSTHPHWSRQECEDYLRALGGPAEEEENNGWPRL